MARFEKNVFVGQRIQIDGHQFIGNTFENCVLVYGGGPLSLTGNRLENVRWEFTDAAARTVGLLSSFYQEEGSDSRRFVELVLSTHGKATGQPAPTPATRETE